MTKEVRGDDLEGRVNAALAKGHLAGVGNLFVETLPAILSALRRVEKLEAALGVFAKIAPSSLYLDDGSEDEEYIVTLRGDYSNPVAFTGKDLARARQALTGEA